MPGPARAYRPTGATPAVTKGPGSRRACGPIGCPGRRRPIGTYSLLSSPLGPLLIARTARGLCWCAFCPAGPEAAMAELEAARPGEGFAPGDPGPTGAALTAYFAGELRTFDEELDVSGSPAARAVWSAIAAIPYGHVRSYGQIAAAAGLGRTAARAAGAACGRNPVSIVVPCHRVVGADGRLVGYGGGLERKRWLLAHEAAVSSRAG